MKSLKAGKASDGVEAGRPESRVSRVLGEMRVESVGNVADEELDGRRYQEVVRKQLHLLQPRATVQLEQQLLREQAEPATQHTPHSSIDSRI